MKVAIQDLGNISHTLAEWHASLLAEKTFLTSESPAVWWSPQLQGRNSTLSGTIVPEEDYKYSLVWPGSRVLTKEWVLVWKWGAWLYLLWNCIYFEKRLIRLRVSLCCHSGCCGGEMARWVWSWCVQLYPLFTLPSVAKALDKKHPTFLMMTEFDFWKENTSKDEN